MFQDFLLISRIKKNIYENLGKSSFLQLFSTEGTDIAKGQPRIEVVTIRQLNLSCQESRSGTFI